MEISSFSAAGNEQTNLQAPANTNTMESNTNWLICYFEIVAIKNLFWVPSHATNTLARNKSLVK
jgi:hypothetical protein